eukprot:Blabericola_migrator_1__13469@NODE_974_length_5854_cov_6_646276_g617_i1_p5_GENE_NODE_974_length_5854_cov_6_646276_g617_i1NODE_974_length_5854_cov_6_646276_g617_i1_p5_ORF_typecomplete_len116_score9_19Spuma_A9PTase/PF03539_14/1_3e06RNase_II_C_S1/PF18614_1/0_33_NODE_974_length_5854_cov_6_646276_g617_i1323670
MDESAVNASVRPSMTSLVLRRSPLRVMLSSADPTFRKMNFRTGLMSRAALEQLSQLMRKYVDLWKDDITGQTHVTEHAIDLAPGRPITCRPPRYSPAEKAIIEQEVVVLQKNEDF